MQITNGEQQTTNEKKNNLRLIHCILLHWFFLQRKKVQNKAHTTNLSYAPKPSTVSASASNRFLVFLLSRKTRNEKHQQPSNMKKNNTNIIIILSVDC